MIHYKGELTNTVSSKTVGSISHIRKAGRHNIRLVKDTRHKPVKNTTVSHYSVPQTSFSSFVLPFIKKTSSDIIVETNTSKEIKKSQRKPNCSMIICPSAKKHSRFRDLIKLNFILIWSFFRCPYHTIPLKHSISHRQT